MDFDIIPYEDIKWGQRLGAGSFGSVYKGSYLGIEIAIKEVLPSTEYDVHKYFEREWRIMRECRHPNIVLFLGLSKAPDDDGRVFIISEYLPRGNLRQYILSSHPFPWRLRLSFATDVARAVAYLHARQCIHRDLKGENLLITSNERIKVTDFGFARIASRNADEMRRMTYCGTDGYMSPEIINGQEFDLPTDVFSLGIIFIEILSRRLVDSRTFARKAPSFTLDPSEVHRRATPGCPPELIILALECCVEEPALRPKMPDVLIRLREIERGVLVRGEDGGEHVGSVKLVHGGKRGMPIFTPLDAGAEGQGDEADEADEKKMEEDALVALAGLDIGGRGAEGSGMETWRTARWEERSSILSHYSQVSDIKGHERLLPSSDTSSSLESTPQSIPSYSTQVIKAPLQTASALAAATPPDEDPSSTITVKGAPSPPPPPPLETGRATPSADTVPGPPVHATPPAPTPIPFDNQNKDVPSPVEAPRVLPTKKQKNDEEEAKEEQTGPSTSSLGLGTHRFTLVAKDGLGANLAGSAAGKKPSAFTGNFAFAFLQKALAAGPESGKCPVCAKRIGQRPALQCDDCTVVVHVKCSHAAPRNCSGGDGSGNA